MNKDDKKDKGGQNKDGFIIVYPDSSKKNYLDLSQDERKQLHGKGEKENL